MKVKLLKIVYGKFKQKKAGTPYYMEDGGLQVLLGFSWILEKLENRKKFSYTNLVW